MPLYTFRCEFCGTFEQWRAMAEYNKPAFCPKCQSQGKRFFSSSDANSLKNSSLSEQALLRNNITESPKSNIHEDYYGHLLFAEELIDRVGITQSIKIDLQKNIERAKKRCADPNLYLAVVGEFSSGKSTFINALLRDDLLKTSALVTTATATHICYGDGLTVEVGLQGTKIGILRTKPNSREVTVSWIPAIRSLDNRQLIHALTSQDEVAQYVTALTVTHPSSFLANQITIIDTPGTNANPQHEAITRQVLELEADTAIIIIPANIPLSQTLINFLSNSLHPFLHRCMFVVTRMDQIREREQSRLLNNLRSRLVEKLGIEPPILYACSAQVSLDLLTNEQPVPDNLTVWGERFTKLEKIIIERLHRERSISIAESILRLLTQLFEQLEHHLKFQWEHYEATQTAIQRETIPDLVAFASEQHIVCHRMLEDAALPARLQVDKYTQKHQERVISALKKAIFGAENETSLKAVIEVETKSILDKEQQYLRQDLQGSAKKISQAVEDASKYFDEKFSTAYRKLEVLSGSAKVKSGIRKSDFQINVSSLSSSAQALNQELDNKDGNTALKGMASGIAIGSAIMPGIGTVVGGVVGAMLSGFFMPSLDQRKQKLWENLELNLDSYFDQVRVQAQEAVEAYKQTSMHSLDERIDDYINSYKAAVEALLTEQEIELNRLDGLQESIEADLAEIIKRQEILKDEREKLTKVSYSSV